MGRSPSPALEENKAFVRGITEDVDESMITNYFSKFGRVTEVYLARDYETKLPRGFAFVTFENNKDCDTACKSLNGKDFHGKPLHVEKSAKPRGGGTRGFRGSRGRGTFSSRGGRSPPPSRDYEYRSRGDSRDDRGYSRGYRRPFTPRGNRGRGPSPARDYEFRARGSPVLMSSSRADKYYGESVASRDRYYREGYDSYPKGAASDYARSRYEASDYRAARPRPDYSPPAPRREYETAPRGYGGFPPRDYYDYPPTNGRYSPGPPRREYEVPRAYELPSRHEGYAYRSSETSRGYGGSYTGGSRISSSYAARGVSPPPRPVAREYTSTSATRDGAALRRQAMRSVSPPPKRMKATVDASYEARRSPHARPTPTSRRF